MAPLCLRKKYVYGEIKPYGADLVAGGYYLTEGAVKYLDLNVKIMQFARQRCSFVLGTRLGYALGSKCGIHITPEYIVGEGVSVNAGVLMRF